MENDELLQLGLKFHGHKCPAMPYGIRCGLAAMKKLGVERASNKELYCLVETGYSHATMCFVDGVQVATGCTFGKSNIEKLDYSKNAIILVDVKSKKAVRVRPKPEFQKKGLASQFVKMRKEGIEPKDIPPEIIDPLVEKIWNAPDDEIVIVSEIFDYDLKKKKSTFEWTTCENCGEVVFGHGIRIRNGKKLCIPCSGYGK